MVVDNLAGSLGYQKSDQAINSISYNNGTTTANNININSGNDIAVKGANLLASNDLTVNAGNDLILESKQNEYHAKGDSKGFTVGMGNNTKTNTSNYSFGVNRGKSRTDKVWVDNQTTLVANNSVTINTNNNTDITGALIANITADGTDGGNLNLTTNTLTFSDIQDTESHYSSSLGVNLAIGRSEEYKLPSQQKTVESGVNLNDTRVSFENEGYEKAQVTRGMIGNGSINIIANSDISGLNRDIYTAQEMTKNTITNNLEGEVSIETLVEAGKIAYSTGKAVYGVGKLGYGGLNGQLKGYGDKAFSDDKKYIITSDGKSIPNPQYDQYAHQKAKEATGNYVGSGGVAVMTGIGVEGYQYPYYSLTYALGLQDNYDPLGLWNENSSRPKPELTGISYAQDVVNDVADMYNGSQGNFNYLENYEAYNKSINK